MSNPTIYPFLHSLLGSWSTSYQYDNHAYIYTACSTFNSSDVILDLADGSLTIIDSTGSTQQVKYLSPTLLDSPP